MSRRPLFALKVRTASSVFLTLTLAVAGAAILTRAQSGSSLPAQPGALADGTMLLPNGWRISPVGRQVTVGTLPLNLVPTPEHQYGLVTKTGPIKP